MDIPNSYVMLSATRCGAGLCRSVEDWRWSSAQAHLRGQDDQRVRVRPLLEMISDWRHFLAQPDADRLPEHIHLHSRTGRPLGSAVFVKELEVRLRRSLRPRKPGPKPKPKNADTLDLLSGLDDSLSILSPELGAGKRAQ